MIDEIILEKLPESWEWIDIKNNIEKIPLTGKKLKKGDYQEIGNFPVIDQGQDFIGGYTDKKEFKITSDFPLVIFGDHTRCLKYIDFDFVPGADGIIVIKPSIVFNPKLFFYFLKAVKLPNKGYARHFQFLEKSFVPLPPLNEQKRIVSKIEELFTKLDAGIQELSLAKEKLKVYRQSVLKYAFEGKLTKEWREANKDGIEPASELLKKIKDKLQENKGYKEPKPIETSKLSKTPNIWEWARLHSIGEIITGSTPKKSIEEYYGENFPFFKPTDLNKGYFVKEANDNLSNIGIKKARLLPEKSILVTCIGATIGKTGFIRVPGASNQQINSIVPYWGILHEFIYYMCISPQFQKDILDNASATTLPILNKSKFGILKIPIPPFTEQQIIVDKIEHKFSISDEIEKSVDKNLIYSQKLRQSILKKAFSGQLVPQEPHDEPAQKLLERIKAEKEKQKTQRKSKQKRLVK